MRHGLGIIDHANFADEVALDLLETNRDWSFEHRINADMSDHVGPMPPLATPAAAPRSFPSVPGR